MKRSDMPLSPLLPTCTRCEARMVRDGDTWVCLACGDVPAANRDTRDPFDQLVEAHQRLEAWLVRLIGDLIPIAQAVRVKDPERKACQQKAVRIIRARRAQLRRVRSSLAWLTRPANNARGAPAHLYCPRGHHAASKAHRVCIAERRAAQEVA